MLFRSETVGMGEDAVTFCVLGDFDGGELGLERLVLREFLLDGLKVSRPFLEWVGDYENEPLLLEDDAVGDEIKVDNGGLGGFTWGCDG